MSRNMCGLYDVVSEDVEQTMQNPSRKVGLQQRAAKGRDRMKAKDFLEQADKIEEIIRNKQVEKMQWRDIAMGVTARYEGERVQSSGNGQKMSDAVVRMVEIEREIDRLIDSQIDARLEIIGTIENLKTVEYSVLHKIYIQHKSFKEVAAERNKSVSWATTVHGRALQSLQKLLDKRDL